MRPKQPKNAACSVEQTHKSWDFQGSEGVASVEAVNNVVSEVFHPRSYVTSAEFISIGNCIPEIRLLTGPLTRCLTWLRYVMKTIKFSEVEIRVLIPVLSHPIDANNCSLHSFYVRLLISSLMCVLSSLLFVVCSNKSETYRAGIN